MTREDMIYELDKAMDILLAVYCDIREERGYGKESKRLDTILNKLNELLIVANR